MIKSIIYFICYFDCVVRYLFSNFVSCLEIILRLGLDLSQNIGRFKTGPVLKGAFIFLLHVGVKFGSSKYFDLLPILVQFA